MVLRWKFVGLKAFIRREKVKVRLSILFQNLEKWQIRCRKSKRKETKVTGINKTDMSSDSK